MRKQQNAWYLLWVLSKTDFKLRYHGSVLGFLWAILKPLCIFAILNFVFSHLFGGTREYSLGLLSGLMLWNFFAEGTMSGLGALLAKGHILTKINAPTWIIICATILTTTYTFLLSLGILALFFVGYGVFPSFLALLATLPFLLALFLLVLGFAFLFSPLYVLFRDLNQMWEVILNAGFYATPIIYPLTMLPPSVQGLLTFNPLGVIIESIKGLLLGTTSVMSPELWQHGGILFGSVFAFFLLSFLFFRIRSRGIAEYV